MQTQTLLEAPLPGTTDELAIFGGPPSVQLEPRDLFTWPIITREEEDAVLDVLRRGAMSGVDVTRQFEADFAAWQGTRYALGFNNGTAAIQAAMFGCHVGVGDEIICPSITYWASALPCFSLGASVVFADIDENSLCLDPNDIEHRITPRTKAIVVVHYLGYPCDMDAIMEIARRHDLKVIEDVSHAQGGLYKGRKLGTIGDVGAMSMMSAKSFAVGEAGMLVTDDHALYERAAAWGHYERFQEGLVESEELKPFAGLPLGGHKYRMHQMSSAVGRVQIKFYDERCAEIRRAMEYFWELLRDVPGVTPHYLPEENGSNMAGCYNPVMHYDGEALGGLSATRFAEAVRAEGCDCHPGINSALHLHPVFTSCDIYGDGQPTRNAHMKHKIEQPSGSLPVSESINSRVCSVPWFKRYRPDLIEEYAAAICKVAANAHLLLDNDDENQQQSGRIGLSARR